MLRKTLLVKRTIKMSSDQGEARLGPCCQVSGFPGCQDDCPLVSWLGPWVPWRRCLKVVEVEARPSPRPKKYLDSLCL